MHPFFSSKYVRVPSWIFSFLLYYVHTNHELSQVFSLLMSVHSATGELVGNADCGRSSGLHPDRQSSSCRAGFEPKRVRRREMWWRKAETDGIILCLTIYSISFGTIMYHHWHGVHTYWGYVQVMPLGKTPYLTHFNLGIYSTISLV